ncbi:hypothetical protein EON63_14935, partial [archaeon]
MYVYSFRWVYMHSYHPQLFFPDAHPTPLPPSNHAFDNLAGGEEVLDLRKLTLTMGGGGGKGRV